MNERQLEPVPPPHGDVPDLRLELERARHALAAAEADLAREQAAVNAFRMHCRLKLDRLVDQLLEVRAEKEGLLARLALLREGIDVVDLLEDDPLTPDQWSAAPVEEEEPLLPTPTAADKAAEKRLFRELARRFHPDLAASAFERSYRTAMMAAVNTAYAAGDSEALYDLAGLMSPDQVSVLAHIPNEERRRLHRSINKLRRLRSKAQRQLEALRQENTARLWRRAQLLDVHDQDGWGVIRSELERAIDRHVREIEQLGQRIRALDRERHHDPIDAETPPQD